MADSNGIACIGTRRWGVRWCDVHDQRLAFCELAAARAPAPEGHEMSLESARNTVWLTCSCGAVGPRRAGEATDAHAQALADRAAHLAGEPFLPVELVDVTAMPGPAVPSAKELLAS